MTRFLSTLLWTAAFLLLLAGIDQLLVRMPATHPAHVAVATFYRDLRSRVIDLTMGPGPLVPPAPAKPAPADTRSQPSPKSIEGIIEQRVPTPAPEPAPRYVYADAQGTIHFAASLAEIPEQYRDRARRLGE